MEVEMVEVEVLEVRMVEVDMVEMAMDMVAMEMAELEMVQTVVEVEMEMVRVETVQWRWRWRWGGPRWPWQAQSSHHACRPRLAPPCGTASLSRWRLHWEGKASRPHLLQQACRQLPEGPLLTPAWPRATRREKSSVLIEEGPLQGPGTHARSSGKHRHWTSTRPSPAAHGRLRPRGVG